jgi:ppGpp synthetase/RelA/SpoT-type nucleotidyltranferase
MKQHKINKIVSQYSMQKDNYAKYCDFLKEKFDDIIKESNIRIVGLQARIKQEDSLKRKLEKNVSEITNYEPKLNGIQDLIGLRIIFYSDADLLNFERFLSIKISEARLDRYQKYNEQYEAIHWVMQFTESQLNELFNAEEDNVKTWSKIRFEIQFTEILSHAFNEFGHDVFYKTPIAGRYNKARLQEQKKQYEDLRINGARKIRADLNKIEQDFKRLVNSSNVFNPDRIKKLINSENENYIYHEINELLGFYDYNLLDQYSHFDIVKGIRDKVETTIVLDKFLEFINVGEIMWIYTDDFIDTFWFLICKFKTGENRDRIKRFADRIFEFRMLRDDKIHFTPYLYFIKFLKQQDQKVVKENFDILQKSFQRFLTLDFRGDRWKSGKELEIRTGKLSPHPKLAELRSATVELIINLYNFQTHLDFKLSYLITLENVTYPGMGDGEPVQKVQDFLWIQCKIILEFLNNSFNNLELEEMVQADQLVDKISHWLPSKKDNQELLKLIKKLESYELYQEFRKIYQTHWFRKSLGFEQIETEANDFREKFVIALKNDKVELSKNYFVFIKNIPINGNDYWKYSALFQLAVDIAEKYPECALEWLDKDLPYKIRENLLLGLWKADKILTKPYLIKFGEEHPSEVLGILEWTKIFDEDVYKSITVPQLYNQKFNVLVSCFNSVGKNIIIEELKLYNEENKPMPVWLFDYKDVFKELIKEVNDEEIKLFTQNLLYHDFNTHHAQHFLQLIIESKPNELLNYLKKVLEGFSSESNPSIFPSLENHDILQKVKLLSPEIFDLFWQEILVQPENYLLKMFIGNFFHEFVPEITDKLIDQITNILDFKDKEHVEALIELLDYYNGEFPIYPIIKLIIDSVNGDKAIFQKINYCLVSMAGVVTFVGIDAQLLRYQRIQQQVKEWNVGNIFKQQFEKYIQKLIISERKNVDDESARFERM